MTTQPPDPAYTTSSGQAKPAEPRPAGPVLAPLRELSAMVLVGVVAALLLLNILNLFAAFLEDRAFSDRAAAEFPAFVGLTTIFLPLVAVLLVTLIKPNTPRALLITVVAVVEYGVAAIFGLVCLFAAFIETVSADVTGSLVDAFLTLLISLVWLVLLGFAAFVVFRVYQGVYFVAKPKPVALNSGYPQGYPPSGYPQGYPQQGYPQQQPGYPPQAAYQAAYGPSGAYPAVPQPQQQTGAQPAGAQQVYQAQPVQQPAQPGGYGQPTAPGYPAAAYQNPGYQAPSYPAAAAQPTSGSPAPSSPVPAWTAPGATTAPTSAPPSPPSPPAPVSAPLAYQANPSAAQPPAQPSGAGAQPAFGASDAGGLEDESARTQLIPSGGSAPAPAPTPAADPADSGEPTQISMPPASAAPAEPEAERPTESKSETGPEDGEEPTQAWRG